MDEFLHHLRNLGNDDSPVNSNKQWLPHGFLGGAKWILQPSTVGPRCFGVPKTKKSGQALSAACAAGKAECAALLLASRAAVNSRRWWVGWWVAGWLAGWLVGWLAGWRVGWLAGWLVGWLAGWWVVVFCLFLPCFVVVLFFFFGWGGGSMGESMGRFSGWPMGPRRGKPPGHPATLLDCYMVVVGKHL